MCSALPSCGTRTIPTMSWSKRSERLRRSTWNCSSLNLHRPVRESEGALRTLSEARPRCSTTWSESRHTVLNIPRIAEFAKANRIPLAGGWGAWARAGGLISFGPNTTEMARHAAEYVGQDYKEARNKRPANSTANQVRIDHKCEGCEMGIDVTPTLLTARTR